MTTQAHFPNEPSSVPAARRFAGDALSGVPPSACHRVLLALSEVATNAVKHAQSSFVVTVHRTPGSVLVEVRDFGLGHPTMRHPSLSEPNGRGLIIVQAMADTWGVEEGAGGKTVWFAVDLDEGSASKGVRHRHRSRSGSL